MNALAPLTCRSASAFALALAIVGISSCAVTTNSTSNLRHYFVPPVMVATPATLAVIDPPANLAPFSLYAAEVPKVTGTIPTFPRPSDADFLLRAANDHFTAGKKAIQDGQPDVARREFDRAIEGLLTAPENTADRGRLERRLEELIDSIYRYDVDELGAGQQEDEVNFEKSPLDEIGDMTFPIDPNLRSRVQDQIRVTASQLPLEVQDPVVSFINYFSSPPGRKIMSAGLRYAGRYRPLIERVLREEGVPQELIFLAQAESGFQPRARSNKECVGLWQFAAFTGRMYGLNQTAATDDRMDPEKATRAAARHLHDLYNHFGDWYLAMAAYNCGSACVDSAVMRTGYADFWTLRRLGALPGETSNYVPIILAMTVMAKNAGDYGLDMSEVEPAVEYDNLELESPTNLALVAAALDRPLSSIKELNPGLFRVVAPAGSTLHVPKGTLDQVGMAFKLIPASRRDSWRIHRVEASETYASIEKHYGLGSGTLTANAVTQAVTQQDMPEPGSFLAVPIAYPGDPAQVVYRGRLRAGTTKAALHSTVRPVLQAGARPTHALPAPHASAASNRPAARTAPLRSSPPKPGPPPPSAKSATSGVRSTGKATPARPGVHIG